MIKTSIISEKEYERLDLFLCEKFQISRNYSQRLIQKGRIKDKVNPDRILKASTPVKANDYFAVRFPTAKNLTEATPEPVDFDVIYSDECVIIVNKPSGLVVHPAPDHWHGTLVNGLLYKFPDMQEFPNKLRPGIVQRLDISTSGLMVIARTQEVSNAIQKMFLTRSIKKTYLALAQGTLKKPEGILSGPIDRDPNNFLRRAVIEGGKRSLTGYKVLQSRNNFSLIECSLLTGRTHQIRVHLSAYGHPIVGDELYGSKIEAGRVMLHSWKLEFPHPKTGEILKFRQAIPEEFRQKCFECLH